jgi:hypothetical protein
MRRPFAHRFLVAVLAVMTAGPVLHAEEAGQWQQTHDLLVARLRALKGKEGAFGASWAPIYHAALPWYELWGGRDSKPVDDWMVSPEKYASELADALEHGRNFFVENPSGLFPLVFEKTLPGGGAYSANYWLSLPEGFPEKGRKFPLIVGLHGSGWLAHKISYKAGGGHAGRTFSVTPIDMAGPWKIDFLNAYLDELLAILPVDTDRVYAEGHSLGAMATWEWALDNPERFAAISPRAGIGEPYRAIRLKDVPSWVIHGARDDVIPSGFADEMVAALQAVGAPVRFTLIKDGVHNMPPDLDEQQVIDWYLRQSRSHLAPARDPRDGLGIGPDGYSGWSIINVPAALSFRSGPFALGSGGEVRKDLAEVFAKLHADGERADAPVRLEVDVTTKKAVAWLAWPAQLHREGPADPQLEMAPGLRVIRFYGRGAYSGGFAHAQALKDEALAKGLHVSGKVWVTNLSIWHDVPATIAEYDAVVD